MLDLLGLNYEDIYEECERQMIDMRDSLYLREYYELNQNL